MSDTNNRAQRGATARLPESESGPRQAVRRPERLNAENEDWSEQQPVNPGWRSERSTGRPSRRSRSALPSSPQEFQLWLQSGGWRYVFGIVLLFIVLLIALLAFGRNDQRDAGLEFNAQPTSVINQPEANVGVGVDPNVPPVATTAPEAPAAPAFQAYVVTGTGTFGLFLRPEPSTNNAPLATLPDGTRVDQIEADVPGGDYVWRKVRTADGQEGWVAVEFLQPAP